MNRLGKVIFIFGAVLFVVGSVILMGIFWPIVWAEITYLFIDKEADKIISLQTNKNNQNNPKVIRPVNNNFTLIIPKLGVNAPVVVNVNPFNPVEYQSKLTQGVAHASGSNLPDEFGNVFLFAHSAGNFYDANRYNAIFYLINKLKPGDLFFIVYKRVVYKYKLISKKIVNPEQVDYLTRKANKRTATLMTCWPPGTTSQRIIIVGDLIN